MTSSNAMLLGAGHISFHTEWHLISSNGFSGAHECNKQMDHATITPIAIAGIIDAFDNSDYSA